MCKYRLYKAKNWRAMSKKSNLRVVNEASVVTLGVTKLNEWTVGHENATHGQLVEYLRRRSEAFLPSRSFQTSRSEHAPRCLEMYPYLSPVPSRVAWHAHLCSSPVTPVFISLILTSPSLLVPLSSSKYHFSGIYFRNCYSCMFLLEAVKRFGWIDSFQWKIAFH